MAEYEVTYSENNWLSVVLEHDDDYYEDPDVYEFTGRKFKCTDKYNTGVYDGN
jgi:hypothetical protein